MARVRVVVVHDHDNGKPEASHVPESRRTEDEGALLTGSLAKMAQDVILLAQTEVAEVAESTDPQRGGSSTMPHKANPVASEMVIAAARANAALLTALHAAAVHEHERATHGWQLEWFTLPQMVALTHGALCHSAFIARNLRVDAGRMQDNLRRAGDVVLAEALAFELSGSMPLVDAQALVKAAAADARLAGQSLVDATRRLVASQCAPATLDWERLADPRAYLGASDTIIDRVLADMRRTVR